MTTSALWTYQNILFMKTLKPCAHESRLQVMLGTYFRADYVHFFQNKNILDLFLNENCINVDKTLILNLSIYSYDNNNDNHEE